MSDLVIEVNGTKLKVTAPRATPLLYVLRNRLRLHGPRFGCGLAQCGACTVMHGDQPVRSCVAPVGGIDKPVTTVEGLGTPERPHPLQTAFIQKQAAQCGFCTSGMMMASASFLKLGFLDENSTEERSRRRCSPGCADAGLISGSSRLFRARRRPWRLEEAAR